MAAVPIGAFFTIRQLHRFDAEFGAPGSHTLVVSTVAAVALALAVAVILAARRLPDARTLFLAVGFLAMSTIFLAHGLGTAPFLNQLSPGHDPGGAANAGLSGHSSRYGSYAVTSATSTTATGSPSGHVGHDSQAGAGGGADPITVTGYSAQLSLLVSALFFTLVTFDLRAGLADWIVRRWSAIAIGICLPLAGHVYAALFAPGLIAWLPLGSGTFQYAMAGIAAAGFVFAAWRFYESYRLAYLPLQGTMALSMVLLVEAQWMMVRGEVWHLSWWLYHFTMLAGFLAPVGGLLLQYRRTGDLGAVLEGLFLRQQAGNIRKGDPRALTALTAAVAAKDTETHDHIERVGELAVTVGRALGVGARDLLVLRWAGRLHDVGKIGVPNRILRKPGPLTPAEFEVIRLHSPRGWSVALHSEMLAEAAPIIRAHHERLDGSGYPDGLVGDEIPLAARIVAVADVWDALTCERPYRRALPPLEAAAIMQANSGSHFDPACLAALFHVAGVEDTAIQREIA